MKNKSLSSVYKRLWSALGLAAVLVFGAMAFKWYHAQSLAMPTPIVAAPTNSSTPSETQLAAQAIIEAAPDKSEVPKSVWLASGMTEREYQVIWEEGTEQPGSSPLNEETRAGTYITKACGLEVFDAEHKYDSGTGWPSFYEANKENLVLKEDYSWLGIKRIEVESKCGEHLGHVFEDGPDPTGLRYCMNGAALLFVPDEPV